MMSSTVQCAPCYMGGRGREEDDDEVRWRRESREKAASARFAESESPCLRCTAGSSAVGQTIHFSYLYELGERWVDSAPEVKGCAELGCRRRARCVGHGKDPK